MKQLLFLITLSGMGLWVICGLNVRAQTPVHSAGIDTLGNCSNADGGFDFELALPTFASGQEVGSTVSIPAARSFSAVPVPMDELTAGEASVVLTDRNTEILACGTIGGRLESNGRVIFGIGEVNGSGISGVAVLAPGPDVTQTGVSLFIVGIDPPTDELGTPVGTPVPATPQA